MDTIKVKQSLSVVIMWLLPVYKVVYCALNTYEIPLLAEDRATAIPTQIAGVHWIMNFLSKMLTGFCAN